MYEETTFLNRMNKLRTDMNTAIRQAADKHNEGVLSADEFASFKDKVLREANEQRRTLLDERKRSQAEAVLDFQKKLAAGGDLTRFREIYEKALPMTREDIENHYRLSIKIGDDTAARAAAFAGVEKNVKSIIVDFAGRDDGWHKTLQQYSEFSRKHLAPEAKIGDLLGEYRTITEPAKKVSPFQAGWTIDERGRRIPFFRNRILYD
jgi:hypothetical protein